VILIVCNCIVPSIESDGSSIVPIIVVPIAIVTAVIGVTLILIIMILCWKYRHRFVCLHALVVLSS